MDGLSIDILGADAIFKELDESPALIGGMIKTLYQNAMDNTFAGSQADCPVDTGELVASGATKVTDNGMDWCFEVSYGDGQSSKTYSYPPSTATTQFSDGSLDADGYSWHTELGHLSRGGNPVPPQAYLGPNYDSSVISLMDSLLELFS